MENGNAVKSGDYYAVAVRHVSFDYGGKSCGENNNGVLKGVNLSLPAGKLCSLLGPSGCGKTTLLRCILGRLKPCSGYINVFDFTPGSKHNPIPGKCIGYMPQDATLLNNFTIQEVLSYFGQLCGLSLADISLRINELTTLLNLPKVESYVNSLSGGQQRRVSLAIALIAKPPLLILDEPTVGIDPILRETIWKHFDRLLQENVTLLITTHYLEEARTSDKIAFLRNGQVLIEENPQVLINKFCVPTLDAVFRKYCYDSVYNKKQEVANNHNISNLFISYNGFMNQFSGKIIKDTLKNGKIHLQRLNAIDEQHGSFVDDNWKERKKHEVKTRNQAASKKQQTLVLIKRNFILQYRDYMSLIFNVISPCLNLALLIVTIGNDPQNMPISVFNEDPTSNYSNLLLSSFRSSDVQFRFHERASDALNAVRKAHTWAAIVIPRNFSHNYEFHNESESENGDTDPIGNSRNIQVYQDLTDRVFALKITKVVYEAFEKFVSELATADGADKATAKFPIDFTKTVYGKHNPEMTDWIAPGSMVQIAFFSTLKITMLSLLSDRKQGVFERTLVTGVTTIQFVVARIVTQVGVMLAQVTLTIFVGLWWFELPANGPIYITFALTLSMGICGMFYGLLVSAICTKETTAFLVALATYVPSMLLAGMIWPVETMPIAFQYVSDFFPMTIPTEAMRCNLAKGWDLHYPIIQLAFLVSFGWTLIFICATIYVFSYRIK